MRDAADAYRALAPAVLGYLRAQRAPDPEDLLAEVFLQVTRDLHKFKGGDDELRRWVFTITYHRLVDARRRLARRPQLAGDMVPDVPIEPVDEALDPSLLGALDRLTPEQREVVVLRFVGDLSLEDVAGITGRTPGAVKAMQHRALEMLARILDAPSGAHQGDERAP
jgi:RNA polymerase sigma factor (sigma-70 family)